jgi:hypothetical protein
VDWNEDGKKDIVTGEYNGNIRIYLNTGTESNPVFSGHTLLKVAGAAFDAGYYSTVHVVDWNENGKKDLLVGESLGYVYLLINTGSNSNPVFAGYTNVKDGSGNLDVGDVSSPAVMDLNGDGKKDLLVGEKEGNLHFFENKGTNEAPAFSGKVLLETGGKVFDCSFYSRSIVVDWENDGVLDILCGSNNGFVYYIKVHGPLVFDVNMVSASTGGKVGLSLNSGGDFSNRGYFVLGSVSGTAPGFPLPGGLIMPLNYDAFTDLVFILVNTPIFVDFAGNLNASGMGSAEFNILQPVDPKFVGVSFYFAYLHYNPFDFVSNAAQVEIIP